VIMKSHPLAIVGAMLAGIVGPVLVVAACLPPSPPCKPESLATPAAICALKAKEACGQDRACLQASLTQCAAQAAEACLLSSEGSSGAGGGG
jgi:hypothetical protein